MTAMLPVMECGGIRGEVQRLAVRGECMCTSSTIQPRTHIYAVTTDLYFSLISTDHARQKSCWAYVSRLWTTRIIIVYFFPCLSHRVPLSFSICVPLPQALRLPHRFHAELCSWHHF